MKPHAALGLCDSHYRMDRHKKFPEIRRVSAAKWRAKNKTKKAEYASARRAREMTGAKIIIPKDLKRLSRLPCAYCGATEKLELDHIVPLSRGGIHSIGNVTVACRSCNASKNNRLLTEWRLGHRNQM